MVNYDSLAATTKRLIEENGRTVTFRQINRDPDNPAEPWAGTTAAPTAGAGGDVQTAAMVFVPPGGGGLGRLAQDLVGQLMAKFDQVGLVAATSLLGIDLETFSELADTDGTVWQIGRHEKLQPATVNILWVLGLKR